MEIWDIISKLRPFEFLLLYRILNMGWSLRREILVAAINATPVLHHSTYNARISSLSYSLYLIK